MIITILSPIVLCAASIWLGYILGQRKSQREYARQLSELARESVQRDVTLAEMEKIVSLSTNYQSSAFSFNWDKIDDQYQWVAIDEDGALCAYEECPVPNKDKWNVLEDSSFFTFLHYVYPPVYFNQCLWKRPKTTHT